MKYRWQRDHPLLVFQFPANFFTAATPVPREDQKHPKVMTQLNMTVFIALLFPL